jgi:hypothetical protein
MKVAGLEEEARLIAGLQKKFNLTPEKAERLLQRVPVVVKKGMSKEEMEKYVRAFEEIGGRIRVDPEEESVAELPDISAEPETEKKAYAGRMITCPQCGFEQPETDECVKCGIVVSRFLSGQEEARTGERIIQKVTPADQYVPWESGEGFISAFFRTAKEVLFSPTQFFKKVGRSEGYWAPFIYGLISGIIGFGGTLLWQWFIFSKWFPVQRVSDLFYSFYFVIITLAIPVMVAFFMLAGSFLIHLSLIIVGGNKKGFETTFRLMSYSFSGYLFGIIPLIGSTITVIYILILMIIGAKEGHHISTGRSLLAILLAVIFGVGVSLLPVILVGVFLKTLGLFGGGGT